MNHRDVLRPLAGLVGATFLLVACRGSRPPAAQEPKTGNAAAMANAPAPSPSPSPPEAPPAATPASSLDALGPPDTDTSATSRRSLMMTDSRGTLDPSSTAIPYPAKIEAPPQAGVDAAIKAVPSAIPTGTLTRSQLEAPL